MKEKGSEDTYVQPALLQLKEEGRCPETVLEHVIVETMPVFKQQKAGGEWGCQVYAPPDIFHQERNEHYQLLARAYAREAKRHRLRPGDIVTLHGTPSSQEIETAAGEKRLDTDSHDGLLMFKAFIAIKPACFKIGLRF